MNIAWLLGMVNKYGGKLKEAWPKLEHAWADLSDAIVIFNDGKPLMMAGPLSPEAQQLLAKITSCGGVDPLAAEELVRKCDEADKIAA